MIDFIQINNDISFDGVDFAGIYNVADSVKQRLTIRLQRLKGEWFLDISKGVDYFGVVKVKNPNVEVINSLLKAEVLKEPRVIEVLNWETEIDPKNRVFKILDTTVLKLNTGEEINLGGVI